MAAQRVLVVDDHPDIVDLVKSYLEREGYEVAEAFSGNDVIPLVTSFMPDVIILDVMLPGTDGFTLTKQLRERTDVPIILLTARDLEEDKVAGLDYGADDYITKPFSPRELLARVRTVLRRVHGHRPAETLAIGDLIIDTERHVVKKSDEEIYLTATEFRLLATLARNPGHVFTRMQLMSEVHGYAFEGYERTIDAHIKNIRQKIEPDAQHPQYIVTVFGVGYKLEDPTDVS